MRRRRGLGAGQEVPLAQELRLRAFHRGRRVCDGGRRRAAGVAAFDVSVVVERPLARRVGGRLEVDREELSRPQVRGRERPLPVVGVTRARRVGRQEREPAAQHVAHRHRVQDRGTRVTDRDRVVHRPAGAHLGSRRDLRHPDLVRQVERERECGILAHHVHRVAREQVRLQAVQIERNPQRGEDRLEVCDAQLQRVGRGERARGGRVAHARGVRERQPRRLARHLHPVAVDVERDLVGQPAPAEEQVHRVVVVPVDPREIHDRRAAGVARRVRRGVGIAVAVGVTDESRDFPTGVQARVVMVLAVCVQEVEQQIALVHVGAVLEVAPAPRRAAREHVGRRHPARSGNRVPPHSTLVRPEVGLNGVCQIGEVRRAAVDGGIARRCRARGRPSQQRCDSGHQ